MFFPLFSVYFAVQTLQKLLFKSLEWYINRKALHISTHELKVVAELLQNESTNVLLGVFNPKMYLESEW